MKSNFQYLILAFVVGVATSPLDNHSSGLFKRVLTKDNTCGLVGGGSNNGYTCDPNLAQGGPCCSTNGYCGSSAAYCGSGCQAAYGACGIGAGSSSTISSTSSVSTSRSSTPSGPTPVGTSLTFCGTQNANMICAAGYCCSEYGYCGQSSAYCGTNCQAAFGACGTLPTTTAATTTTVPAGPSPSGSTTTCGPQGGNAVCAAGLCCSASGFCGTGINYCTDPDCQFNFGTCDSNTTPAGASTINDPRPVLGGVTYTDDIFDCIQANTVALTFDDGPYQYTDQLLNILKQYNFKATFFITGNNLHKGAIDVTTPYPTIIKRMIAEGHQVASHTWSHYDLSLLTTAQRVQQMVKNERAIANIIGRYPTYMRPPYSSCSQESGCWNDMATLGYHRTYFDLDTQDYLNQSPQTIQNSKDIVSSALRNAAQGTDFLSIQHDIGQQSVANFSSYYFDLINTKGWRGVTVGECLGDSEVNWYRIPGTGQGTTGGNSAAVSAVSISTLASTTTSTTSKSLTSTSNKSTATPKSSSSSTSATKTTTTTTKITTPSSSAATPECDQPPSGTFCGRILPFSTRGECSVARDSCKVQAKACKGQGSRAACDSWAKECDKLDKYCQKCGGNCSNKGFKASEE